MSPPEVAADALADYIRDEVCCPRPVGGCEQHCYPEECPAERVRTALAALQSERDELRKVVEQIGRMRPFPDDVINRTTLQSAIRIARRALSRTPGADDDGEAAHTGQLRALKTPSNPQDGSGGGG